MNRQIRSSKDLEDETLEEEKESVREFEDEDLDASNGSSESDSSAKRAESQSAELSPRLLPSSTTPFGWSILAKKAPRGTPNKSGCWVIEALYMGDDSADEEEKTLWRGVVHESTQAKAAYEKFYPIVWEAELFTNARDTLIVLPTYTIGGSKAKQKKRATKDSEIPARRKSRQDTRKPRKLIVTAHVNGFLQNHPGVAVILSGIGGRKNHPERQKHLVTHEKQPYIATKSHTCVQAALVNATFAMAGREAAGKVQQLIEEDKSVLGEPPEAGTDAW